MPQRPMWAPLVHKTTMGKIMESNSLLKAMLPANAQTHTHTHTHTRATLWIITMPVSPHPHSQHHCAVASNLCRSAMLGPDWGKKDGVKSESISVLLCRIRIRDGGRCFDKPTKGMPVPCSFSVVETQVMTDQIRDGPNAPFNKWSPVLCPLFRSTL